MNRYKNFGVYKCLNRPLIIAQLGILILSTLFCLSCRSPLRRLTTTKVKDSRLLYPHKKPSVKGKNIVVLNHCAEQICLTSGELLHISYKRMLLKGTDSQCPIQIENSDVVSFILKEHYKKPQASIFTPILLTSLATISNGVFLVLSLPITLLFGGMEIAEYSHIADHLTLSGSDLYASGVISKLRYFSRFPDTFPQQAYNDCTIQKKTVVSKQQEDNVKVEYEEEQEILGFAAPSDLINKEQKIDSKSSNKVIGFWERYTDLRLELAFGFNWYEIYQLIGRVQALINLNTRFRALLNVEYSSDNHTGLRGDDDTIYDGKIGPHIGLGAEIVLNNSIWRSYVLQGSYLFSNVTMLDIPDSNSQLTTGYALAQGYQFKLGYRNQGLLSNYGFYLGFTVINPFTTTKYNRNYTKSSYRHGHVHLSYSIDFY